MLIGTFLGFELDSLKKKIKIPADKRCSIKDLMFSYMARKKATLKKFQALTGLIFVEGPFTTRIYDFMQCVVKPHYYIRDSVAIK